MKKIYLAGPLFNESEKRFNSLIVSILENNGYQVFLPQRDGYEAVKLNSFSENEKIDMIFKKDTSEIKNSDILFFILDGRLPDEGACVELGIAYTMNKRCYGLKTDVRSFEKNIDINPLIAGCLIKIFTQTQELENFLLNSTL